jgi:putative integrase
MRTGSHIDEFVTEAVAARLGQPDAMRKHQTAGEVTETSAISAAIAEQRGRILRAQRDYDDEVIEGRDLKRIREAAEARITQLEAERLLQGRGGALAPILGTDDPATAFREAPLEVQRQVIDTLATVTLHSQPRGRGGASIPPA